MVILSLYLSDFLYVRSEAHRFVSYVICYLTFRGRFDLSGSKIP